MHTLRTFFSTRCLAAFSHVRYVSDPAVGLWMFIGWFCQPGPSWALRTQAVCNALSSGSTGASAMIKIDSIRFPSGLELNRKITIACAGERLDTLDATDMDRLHLSWPRQHTGKMWWQPEGRLNPFQLLNSSVPTFTLVQDRPFITSALIIVKSTN
jgi:hypothetical protein